jgi:hypothetical protein
MQPANPKLSDETGVEQTFRSAVMIPQKSFLAPQARAQR